MTRKFELDDRGVRALVQMIKAGHTNVEIAERFGVCKDTVSRWRVQLKREGKV